MYLYVYDLKGGTYTVNVKELINNDKFIGVLVIYVYLQSMKVKF